MRRESRDFEKVVAVTAVDHHGHGHRLIGLDPDRVDAAASIGDDVRHAMVFFPGAKGVDTNGVPFFCAPTTIFDGKRLVDLVGIACAEGGTFVTQIQVERAIVIARQVRWGRSLHVANVEGIALAP